ncbi:MAG: HAMP domain-containing protein [Proteobacteria bacterium]|nr:HAMP domain-containing protein [Pseudomonadota bacterium]
MGLREKIFLAFFSIVTLLLGVTLYYTNSQTTAFELARIVSELRKTQGRFEEKFESERKATLRLVDTITSDQKYRSFLQQVRDNYFSFAEEIGMDTKADLVFVVDDKLAVRGTFPLSKTQKAANKSEEGEEKIEEAEEKSEAGEGESEEAEGKPDDQDQGRDAHVAWVLDRVEEVHVDELLAEILESGKSVSRVLSFGDALMNTVNVPLKESLSDDYALGVVSVGFTINDAWVKQLLKDEGAEVNAIFHIDGKAVAANVSNYRRAALLKAALADSGAATDGTAFNFKGERYIMLKDAFAKAGRPAGYVFAASLDKAMAPFISLQWKIFVLGVVALIIGLVIMLGLANRIVHPIRLLVTGTKEVLDGNYDYKVEPQSSDEVGVLTRAFNDMTKGLQEKEQIRNLFGKYVHPSIVGDLLENPDNLKQGGTQRVQTLLFSDIAGFTTISEGMDAESLVAFLNEYLRAMADELAAYEGILDKYLGDGIMAFWGPPLTKGNHARLACNAALSMQNILEDMRKDWQARGLPPIHARIGLATGEVIVGNIGSERSQDYTCIGDTVNLASRLEGVNKVYGTRIMIDEATLEMTENHFRVRELDTVRVKGRDGGTRIFELIGFANDAEADPDDRLRRYADALALYRSGDFAAALKGFQSIDDDSAAAAMAGACQELINEPPENWDGIHAMTAK